MKNTIKHLMLAAAVLVPGSAIAQEPTTQDQQPERRHRHGHMGEKFAKELGLTDAQKTQLKAMKEEQHSKMRALKANDQLTREEKHAQAKQLRQDFRSRMESILTAEQKEKFAKLRAEKMKHRGRHRRHRDGAEDKS